MDEIKTKNMRFCINQEENYVVIHCNDSIITYPLDEIRKVFGGF